MWFEVTAKDSYRPIPQDHASHLSQEMADLHIKYIPDGFLAQLGHSFLATLYNSLSQQPTTICVYEVRDEQLAGFLLMLTDRRRCLNAVLRRHFLPLSIQFLRVPSNILKVGGVGATLRFAARSTPSVSGASHRASIFNFVVVPSLRGTGLAGRLFRAACKLAKEAGVVEVEAITGSAQFAANAFYRKMGFMLIGHTEVHRGIESNIYLLQLEKNADLVADGTVS